MVFLQGYQTEEISVGQSHIGYIYSWPKPPAPGEKETFLTKDRGHAACILPNRQMAGYGYDQGEALEKASSFQQEWEIGLPGKISFNDQFPPRFRDVSVQ